MQEPASEAFDSPLLAVWALAIHTGLYVKGVFAAAASDGIGVSHQPSVEMGRALLCGS
jgi:hypothetical protein